MTPIRVTGTHYRTSDGGAEFVFEFVRYSSGWRIYIERQPDYGDISTNMDATHRVYDGDRYFICWDRPLQTLSDAKAVAALWADATQTYRKSGRFEVPTARSHVSDQSPTAHLIDIRGSGRPVYDGEDVGDRRSAPLGTTSPTALGQDAPMPTIVNLTPHDVTVIVDGERQTWPSTGAARVIEVRTELRPLAGIPRFAAQGVEVRGLPDAQPGTYLVVSRMVLDALPDRIDLVAPDTGATALRDDRGRIEAVTAFIANKDCEDR